MLSLQQKKQSMTRPQLAEYLVTNIDAIPNDSLKYVKSQKTGNEYQPFMRRLSFALTSLSKAQLIKHPKRGITELTELGKNINPNDSQYIHQLVMKGWHLSKQRPSKPRQINNATQINMNVC
ncbi:winged helix-turn-helix domain-containing protein [[Lactobacillus] timonensis]|jgi:restriction endonuclease Mrr|uniref:winged helix-turn-helix domain-containing protein n=1 Tax=[Lactobacillus] timonensis TaxID=1970790 RepID=UPI000C8410C3|nr:winged helix-turn-helix domain-containing protein [[Lactobacillus] timonensis]